MTGATVAAAAAAAAAAASPVPTPARTADAAELYTIGDSDEEDGGLGDNISLDFGSAVDDGVVTTMTLSNARVPVIAAVQDHGARVQPPSPSAGAAGARHSPSGGSGLVRGSSPALSGDRTGSARLTTPVHGAGGGGLAQARPTGASGDSRSTTTSSSQPPSTDTGTGTTGSPDMFAAFLQEGELAGGAGATGAGSVTSPGTNNMFGLDVQGTDV